MGIGFRIKKMIEDKGVTPYNVSIKTGISQSTLSRILNDNSKKPNIENTKILAKYFNVSEDWLLTGEEKSIDTEPQKSAETTSFTKTYLGVPIYDIDFMAGDVSVFNDESFEIIGHLNIPELKGAEKVIRARGDSMTGIIDDTDFIGIKRVYDFSFFNYGSPYAIATADYRLLKYIRKSDNPDNIILRSHNANYDDIELPKKSLVEVHAIIAVLPFSKIKTFM
jgi:transcriptional regulator with XRE-family HTH domain